MGMLASKPFGGFDSIGVIKKCMLYSLDQDAKSILCMPSSQINFRLHQEVHPQVTPIYPNLLHKNILNRVNDPEHPQTTPQ